MSKFCAILSNWRYSSKVTSISCPTKLTEPFSGTARSGTGGMESMGPPCGPIPLLAHEAMKRQNRINIQCTMCDVRFGVTDDI